jgi:hypothetical protein
MELALTRSLNPNVKFASRFVPPFRTPVPFCRRKQDSTFNTAGGTEWREGPIPEPGLFERDHSVPLSTNSHSPFLTPDSY